MARHDAGRVRPGALVDGVAPGTLDPDEAGEAVRHAQAELERAVREGNLAKDPMRFPLGALAVTLGAQHQLHVANIRQTRFVITGLEQLVAAIKEPQQVLDPAALVRLEKAAATGADRRTAALARAHTLRTVLIAAGVLVGSIVAAGVVGYWWGSASMAASVHETEGGLAEAFRDGPAAAAGWLDLMRNNDLPNALATCKGNMAFTDQLGAPSCLIPLRTAPPRPEAPAKVRS